MKKNYIGEGWHHVLRCTEVSHLNLSKMQPSGEFAETEASHPSGEAIKGSTTFGRATKMVPLVTRAHKYNLIFLVIQAHRNR